MREFREGWIGIIAAAMIVGAGGPMPASRLYQASPCRTAADTASAVQYDVKQMFASNDLDTTGVSIVTDSATCQAVIDSYNTNSDSSLRVESGYVVRADTTLILYLPAKSGTPYKAEVLVLFDGSFRILTRMWGLN